MNRLSETLDLKFETSDNLDYELAKKIIINIIEEEEYKSRFSNTKLLNTLGTLYAAILIH